MPNIIPPKPDIFFDPKRSHNLIRCAGCREVITRRPNGCKPEDSLQMVDNGRDAVWIFCGQKCYDTCLKVFSDPLATHDSTEVKKLKARSFPLSLKPTINKAFFHC